MVVQVALLLARQYIDTVDCVDRLIGPRSTCSIDLATVDTVITL